MTSFFSINIGKRWKIDREVKQLDPRSSILDHATDQTQNQQRSQQRHTVRPPSRTLSISRIKAQLHPRASQSTRTINDKTWKSVDRPRSWRPVPAVDTLSSAVAWNLLNRFLIARHTSTMIQAPSVLSRASYNSSAPPTFPPFDPRASPFHACYLFPDRSLFSSPPRRCSPSFRF